MKKYTWITVALLLMLVLAACGGKTTATPAAEQPAAATSAEQPAADSSTGDQSAGTEELNFGGEAALDSLSSYRSRIYMKEEADGAVVNEMTIEQEETRNPLAQRMVWSGTGDGNLTGFEMITVDGVTWMNLGDSNWMMTEQSEEEAFGATGLSIADPTTYDTSDYTYVGNETVNGVNCRHYTIKAGALELSAMAGDFSEVTSASMDLWVSDDGLNLTMKFAYLINGTKDGKSASYTLTQELYDVNVPFTIEVPAEAASSGLPADIPAYSNATDKTAMSGMYSFSTVDDVATVTAFYDAQLPANGWTKDPSSMEGYMTFTKDGNTLSVMISAKDEGGSDVVLMVTAQ